MYDAIIVGAGPGGATAAALMARSGLNVLLVDKDRFPRDKICGDAISGKSVGVLRRLGLIDQVLAIKQVGTWGITFGAPGGDVASIPFSRTNRRDVPLGFVCAREVFDPLLLACAREAGVEIRQGVPVEGLLKENEKVVGVRLKAAAGETSEEVRAKVVVGADGAYSTVVRELGMAQLDEDHYCGGLRAYYEGVTGFNEGNFLEVHFVPEVIPGYFWIFPMADGRANVGVGMLSSAIKKRDVRLKELLKVCIEHPRFAHRFKDARPIDKVRGWGIPLGSKPRKMAGDGWLLVGDAASLVDPFSGEGIGNAMVSAEIAAEWTLKAVQAQDTSAMFLGGYEKAVLDRLSQELRVSHLMQRLINWQGLLNFVVRKASRSRAVADTLSCMFDDESERRKLISPMFYLRLLTA